MQAYGFDESNAGKATPLPPPDEGASSPPPPAKDAVVARDYGRGNHRVTPAAVSAAPNLTALINALRRRWPLALTVGILLGVCVGLGAWFFRPVNFIASGLLHVNAFQDRLLDRGPGNPNTFSDYQRNQIALIKTRTVLNTALRNDNTSKLSLIHEQADPIDWLQKQLAVDFPAPEIMRISMRGDRPNDLRLLVDAVKDAYLKEVVEKDKDVTTQRLNRVMSAYSDYDDGVRAKKTTLKQMEQTAGGPHNEKYLAAIQEFKQEYLNRVRIELLNRDAELRNAKLELDDILANEKKGERIAIPAQALNADVNKDPGVKKLQDEIGFQERLGEHYRKKFNAPEAMPEYRTLLADIEQRKKNLETRRQELRALLEKNYLALLRDNASLARQKAGRHVDALTRAKKDLNTIYEEKAKEAEVAKAAGIELGWLQEEIQELDTFRKELYKQRQALELELRAPARVRELEVANVVPTTTEGGRVTFALMAGFATLFASIFGIAFLEFKARRVSHVEEVTQGLKIHLMGSLPNVPKRALAGSTAARDVYWQNRLTESVDAIRTTLMNAARFEGLRVVMVTSAVGGEGKTLLACHLAASLARAGLKTLLIDGDLRRPSVHRLFGLPLPGGLSELLQGEIDVDKATHMGLMDGLSVISAGQRDSRSAQALAGQRVREILDQLRGSYEFIVVDSAPVLPIADSQLIGQHTDGVVFSIMRDVSRLPQVYAAYERLSVLRIRTLGAVVNGISGGSYGSGDYYYIASTPSETASA